MTQEYRDPTRRNDPYALPDIEVWFHQHGKRELMCLNAGHVAELYGECITDDDGDCTGTGWYYWFCFPGCLPDSEPIGPFETRADALEDACAGMDDTGDEEEDGIQ